jgi:prophage regulatory protein
MAEQSIYRLPDVKTVTGLSRSTIYAMIQRGEFPAPIHLSVRAVGWPREAVEAFLARRIEASQAGR